MLTDLAECYFQIKQFQKAIDLYNSLIDNLPFNKKFYFNRATSYLKINDYIRGRDDFYTLFKQDSLNEDVICNLGFLYYKMKKFDSAIVFFTKAEIINENNMQPYYYISLIQFKNLNYNLALKNINKAILLSPDNFDLYLQRALIYCNLNNDQSANEDFKRFSKLKKVNKIPTCPNNK